METKITLVPTHSIQSEVNDQAKKQTISNGYKPYKSQGKYRAYKRKYDKKPYDNEEPSKNQLEKISEQNEEVQEKSTVVDETKQQIESSPDYNRSSQVPQGGYDVNGQADQQDHKYICVFPRVRDYNDLKAVAQTFPHLANVNTGVLEVDGLRDLRCFILRSNNEDDIHKAIKYGIWTSTPKSNDFLKKVYEECTPKKIPIFLFYSVVRSGQFVAVAQMTSNIIDKSFQFWWEGDKWVNHFQVKWLFVKDVPYKHFRHLYMDDDLPVTRARDCTSVPLEVTKEMLHIYKDYEPYNSIFNAFPYMDVREDMLRSYKYSLQAYQQQMMSTYSYNQSAETNQADNQAAPQYFKYNALPIKPKDIKGNGFPPKGKSSLKKDPTCDLEKLLEEYETRFSFYSGEKKKWDQDSESVKSQAAKEASSLTPQEVEALLTKHENLKFREKEILEGIEILDSKYQGILVAFEEKQQQQSGDSNSKEKLSSRIGGLKASLEGFKENFSSSQKSIVSLYEKIEKLQ